MRKKPEARIRRRTLSSSRRIRHGRNKSRKGRHHKAFRRCHSKRREFDECRTLGGCRTGEAKITGGYNLPAKYVIHTVGPIYSGSESDPGNLYNCYMNSLNLARANDVHSIAFPCISTGVYGYPKDKAAQVSSKAAVDWIKSNSDYDMEIIFCCFDDRSCGLYKEILNV